MANKEECQGQQKLRYVRFNEVIPAGLSASAGGAFFGGLIGGGVAALLVEVGILATAFGPSILAGVLIGLIFGAIIGGLIVD